MKLSYLFCFAFLCIIVLSPSASPPQVAITVDDLPSHGPLPPGMTRTDAAKSILDTLRQAHAPKVYGFVNAKKLEEHPEEIEVLKLWREAYECGLRDGRAEKKREKK